MYYSTVKYTATLKIFPSTGTKQNARGDSGRHSESPSGLSLAQLALELLRRAAGEIPK